MPRIAPVARSLVASDVQNQHAIAPCGQVPHVLGQQPTDVARQQETTDLQLARSVWAAAFQSLALVLINAAVSVMLSWLSAFTIAQGNIFSSNTPSAQSSRTFLVGVLLWIHLWFCTAVWVGCSVSLIRLELISHIGRPVGVARALGRMFRRTVLWFLFSGAVVAGIGFGFGSLDASYRKFRLEFYTSALLNYTYVYVADRTARRIYRNETVEGRARQQQKQQQDKPPRSRRRHLSLLASSSHLLSMLVPTVYVHSISYFGVIASTERVWLFMLASLVLKVMMQEAAKLYIIRSNIQSPRTMATVVAVPTALIDTQVRIVLLRFQDVQVAMSTTVAIAVAEVCVRICKTLLIKWHIQTRQRRITRRTSIVTRTTTKTTSTTTATATVRAAAAPTATEAEPSSPNPADEFELWRAQLQRYHAIEVNADMYAEYLAIGCSSAIMVMFGQHPQFLLTRASDSKSSSLSSSWTSVSVHVQLLTQVAIEVVVDLVSCAVEVSSGLAFAHVNRERAYFLALCIGLAFVNVNISAVLNLAY